MLPMTERADLKDGWGYLSGVCASREASLLDREFFEELLKEETPDGAYGRVAKSVYGRIFPHVETIYEYDHFLRDEFRGSLVALQAVSPANGPPALFLRGIELIEVHELLIRQGVAQATPEEIERWVERLAGSISWMSGCSVRAEQRTLFPSHPVRAVSLLVDAAYLMAMRAIGIAQPGLRAYVEAYIALHVLNVCARSFASGIGPEWLSAFFFCDGLSPLSREALRRASEDRSAATLVRLLAPSGFSCSAEDFEELYAKRADDCLTAIARRGAYEVSGVARVLHYVRQLWVEHFNMRLCLSAVLTPLDRRQAHARLRNG